MNNIKNHFLKGILYIVPIAAIIWVIWKSYTTLNSIIGDYLPENMQYLGIIILLIIITAFGYLGSVFIASPINDFFRKILEKAPLLKTIYSSVQDLTNTFVGDKKGFRHPVLVKVYENSTIERIGFITNEDVESLNVEKGKVLVYLPHSYAISGQLFVVDRSYITPIDRPSSEIMKLIVSGGITEIEK